jgi:hypothetical protein
MVIPSPNGFPSYSLPPSFPVGVRHSTEPPPSCVPHAPPCTIASCARRAKLPNGRYHWPHGAHNRRQFPHGH